MRPPAVSLCFFAAAFGLLAYGVIATRNTAPVDNYLAHTAAPTAQQSPPTKDRAFPDFAWRFNALDPGLDQSAATSIAFDPSDDYWGMPRDEGVDLVAGYCAACHSLRIVMQQHSDEARWRALMDWMIEKQGMAEPPEEDLEQIIRYLSKNFGAA